MPPFIRKSKAGMRKFEDYALEPFKSAPSTDEKAEIPRGISAFMKYS